MSKLPGIDDKPWLPAPSDSLHILRHYKQRDFETVVATEAIDLKHLTSACVTETKIENNVEYAYLELVSDKKKQCKRVLTTRAEAARLRQAWREAQ